MVQVGGGEGHDHVAGDFLPGVVDGGGGGLAEDGHGVGGVGEEVGGDFLCVEREI